jgi:hypothetical protein
MGCPTMGKDLDTGEKAGPHDKAMTGLKARVNRQRYGEGRMKAAHARPPHQSLQTRAPLTAANTVAA